MERERKMWIQNYQEYDKSSGDVTGSPGLLHGTGVCANKVGLWLAQACFRQPGVFREKGGHGTGLVGRREESGPQGLQEKLPVEEADKTDGADHVGEF